MTEFEKLVVCCIWGIAFFSGMVAKKGVDLELLRAYELTIEEQNREKATLERMIQERDQMLYSKQRGE